MALSDMAKEIIWQRRLMRELCMQQRGATRLYEDNEGTIAIGCNTGQHKRAKHIDICYHHVRELIERNTIVLQHCPSADMAADVMTKQGARA